MDSPVRGPFQVMRPRDVPPEATAGTGEAVVVNLGSGTSVLPKGQMPTSGMKWFRPKGQYWIVDMRTKGTTLEVELDSSDTGLRFQGTVDVDWRVSSAERAVEEAPFNVAVTLERWLLPSLNRVARRYGMARVDDLEDRISQEVYGWAPHDALLTVERIACLLRSDTEVTGVMRKVTIDGMKRDAAGEVLSEGKAGMMKQLLADDPESAMRIYEDMRQDEQVQLLAELEMAKAVAGSDSTEEHERHAVINGFLERLRNDLPKALTELPPGSKDTSEPRDEAPAKGRDRRRDRRLRGEGSPDSPSDGTDEPRDRNPDR
ncbi:hypothetical protein [Streptomyces phaeochromogenes]|uniref:hypothetical protein n=1 Tax=Streptomyces phaeochromogenes TaxID=1923 RepID=UPI0036BE399F